LSARAEPAVPDKTDNATRAERMAFIASLLMSSQAVVAKPIERQD